MTRSTSSPAGFWRSSTKRSWSGDNEHEEVGEFAQGVGKVVRHRKWANAGNDPPQVTELPDLSIGSIDVSGTEPGSSAEPEPLVPPPPSWVAPVFVVMGIGLLPWTVVLALTLPARHGIHHYGLAWTGFDIALAVTLLVTGIGAYRRAAWLQGVAAASATLLICDAWFDVLSSTSRRETLIAVALALLVELPVAAACLFVARHAEETAARAHRYAALVRTFRSGRRRSP